MTTLNYGPLDQTCIFSPNPSSILKSSSLDCTSHDLSIPIALRKGTYSYTMYPIAKYVWFHKLSQNYKAFTSNLSSVSLPKTIQEVLSHIEWRTIIIEEMKALKKNDTWEIVELLRDKMIVGCKWVFMVKYQADGSIDRYKARLVAKGFN